MPTSGKPPRARLFFIASFLFLALVQTLTFMMRGMPAAPHVSSPISTFASASPRSRPVAHAPYALVSFNCGPNRSESADEMVLERYDLCLPEGTGTPIPTPTNTPAGPSNTTRPTVEASITDTPTPTPTSTGSPGTATATPTSCPSAWLIVSSSDAGTGMNNLFGIASLSATDVWAVGDYYTDPDYMARTLVEHWDGVHWSVVPSPNPGTRSSLLTSVTAISAGNVWAVGHYDTDTGPGKSLTMHWDGTQWSVVPSPSVGNDSILNGVAAVSSSDVWAVGDHYDGSVFQTLIEHWNGSTWSVIPSPNLSTDSNELFGLSVVSSRDIWAVGDYVSTSTYLTLIEHWNGSRWSVVPSPNVSTSINLLNGVAAISSSDVWTVGSYGTGPTSLPKTLVEHWDGAQWSVVPSPNVSTRFNLLNGVAAVSSRDVWAVGYYELNGNPDQTLIERWNGTAWSVVPSPNVSTDFNDLNGVAAVSSSDVWAVGEYQNDSPFHTLTVRYGQCIPPTPTATACPIHFSDVPAGSTFYPFIRCLACRGLINGYPDTTFRPDNAVTRGQLSKIVSNAAGFADPQTIQMFQDVPVGSTFQVFIGRLASRGYISGYPCGGAGEPCVPPSSLPYFRPDDNATRGQISKIVSNAAGFADPPSGQQFEDVAVGSSYYTYTYRLISRAIMAGYPCGGAGEPCVPPTNMPYFRPNNDATRGQTSKIVSGTFFSDCQTLAFVTPP